MYAKMNHSDEWTFLTISLVGVAFSWLFSHLREISSIIALLAAIPVLVERWRPIITPIITQVINKIKIYVGKIK